MTDFGQFLEAELIEHIVGRSYRPKGGGKVESAVGTLRRELWDVYQFADRVLAAIDAISRRRQGALAMVSPAGAAVEEIGEERSGAPLEVLRLAIVDGAMELRFCGTRVWLGRVET